MRQVNGPESVIECVANVSEGRDSGVIQELGRAISAVSGTALLHVDSGIDANRTVFTFAGNTAAVLESAYQLVNRAQDLLDMRRHSGTHPRIGAVDVCPFVPLYGISEEELVPLVAELGRRIGMDLGVTVFFYQANASTVQRRELSFFRRGNYEGLRERIESGELVPDCGSASFDPGFGALVIGVRGLLVAYNISLDSPDVTLAKRIASEIREAPPKAVLQSPQALSGVRAIGWLYGVSQCVQVSTNLVRPLETGLFEVYSAVRALAAKERVAVLGSELIGLVPFQVMINAGSRFVSASVPTCAAEERLMEQPVEQLVCAAVQGLGLSLHQPFVAQERILELALSLITLNSTLGGR